MGVKACGCASWAGPQASALDDAESAQRLNPRPGRESFSPRGRKPRYGFYT